MTTSQVIGCTTKPVKISLAIGDHRQPEPYPPTHMLGQWGGECSPAGFEESYFVSMKTSFSGVFVLFTSLFAVGGFEGGAILHLFLPLLLLKMKMSLEDKVD